MLLVQQGPEELVVFELLELVEVEVERQLVLVLEVEQFLENKYCFFFFEPVELELALILNFVDLKKLVALQKLKLVVFLLQLLLMVLAQLVLVQLVRMVQLDLLVP